MSEYPTMSSGELEEWELKMQQAFSIIGAEESKEFIQALEIAYAEKERKVRKEIAEMTYLESFDLRLQVLVNFANAKQLADKEEHVFSTILNGIRTAVEMKMRFEGNDELEQMNPKLRARFEKNMLTPEDGRRLVMRAIKFIKQQGWSGSFDELKKIWTKESVLHLNSPKDGLAWTGGGQLLAEILGQPGKRWQPFDMLSGESTRE